MLIFRTCDAQSIASSSLPTNLIHYLRKSQQIRDLVLDDRVAYRLSMS